VTAMARIGNNALEHIADQRVHIGNDFRERKGLPGRATTWVTNWPPAECFAGVAMLIFTPNSQCLWALPLPMHSTSGACSE
jgi:hypothetical protein